MLREGQTAVNPDSQVFIKGDHVKFLAISSQNGTVLGGAITTKPHDLSLIGVNDQAEGREASLNCLKTLLESAQGHVRGGASGIEHCVIRIEMNSGFAS